MPLPFSQIMRDFVADGVPPSGSNHPRKADLRAWGSWVESLITAFTSNGGLIYSSLATLNADLAHAAASMAWVLGDPTAANNGVYKKSGASGAGSWTRVGDLPYSFIVAADTGAGIPNAIQATTSIPVSGSALIVSNVFEANTGSPVTISFNGGPALTIKTNSGNDVVANGVAAGMLIFGYIAGSTFRLISDQVSSAIVAAAEDAANRAESAAAALNIPAIAAGDKGKGLTINAGETGYDKNLLSIVIASRAALKLLTTSIDRPVYLSENGRQGMFVLRTGDPPVTDTQEGIYVVSNTAGHYWERVYAPALYPSVYAFGALGGSNDDTLAVQGALDVIGTAYLPYRSNGYTFGNVTLAGGKRILGERQVVVKSTALVGGYVVRVTTPSVAAGVYGYIKDITFDLAAADTASTAIRFGIAAGVVFGFRGTGLQFKSCGEAIGDEVHASNYVVDIYFQDCLCFLTRGRQVYNRRSRGFFTFRDFKIDHTYNTSQVTWEGARFVDLIGLELEKFDVVGPTQPASTYQASAVGLVIAGVAGSASVWLRRVLVDNTRGPGVDISNIHNVFAVDLCIFQNLGGALLLTNVLKSLFVNTKIVGGIGLTGAPASANGISMTTCTSVTFEGLEVESNTGHGVVMASCTDCSVIGGYSNSNTGSGYVEATAATRNLRSGVRALSNGGSSLVQIGAQSATTSWWANGGTFIASTVGGITV